MKLKSLQYYKLSGQSNENAEEWKRGSELQNQNVIIKKQTAS